MTIQITQGAIEFTRKAGPHGRLKRVYPFPDMQVGDGFPLPEEAKKSTSIMTCACGFVRTKNLDWKFSKRTDKDGNKWCVRIK